MTRKQSFAIYCKTGVDVRACDLDQETISFILNNYWLIGRNVLTNTKGSVLKAIPAHKGDWKVREYELLHEYALDQAKTVYIDKDKKQGKAEIVFNNGRHGFVKYIGKTIEISFGKSLAGNIESAMKYCATVYNLTGKVISEMTVQGI